MVLFLYCVLCFDLVMYYHGEFKEISIKVNFQKKKKNPFDNCLTVDNELLTENIDQLR